MALSSIQRCRGHTSERESFDNLPADRRRARPAEKISLVLAWPLIFLIKIYRATISPFLGECCRFYPSCSSYALESLRRYGIFRGLWLAAKRLLRCHPLCQGGIDPVP